jgi:hypothetical protein
MKLSSPKPFDPLLRRTAVALAMAAGCASAYAALPPFTLNPAAASPALAGTSVTADNMLISDFSTVTFDGAGHFSDSGYLSVIGLELGGELIAPDGLNSAYGMYIQFTGSGNTTGSNPAASVTTGAFTNLTYTLFGYNGHAGFGFSGNTPTTTASGQFVLATGSLINGNVATIPSGDGSFTPSAAAKLTFAAAAGESGFFAAPNPFYNLSFAAFTDTLTEVHAFDGGFRIDQGGGAINFAMAPAVPEPATYALMLAGLGAIGFVAMRRRRQD